MQARSRKDSLNECLLPGPLLTPLILDILLRFRLNQTMLVGDLEKAFLNVKIKPEDKICCDSCGWTMWTRLAHRYKH